MRLLSGRFQSGQVSLAKRGLQDRADAHGAISGFALMPLRAAGHKVEARREVIPMTEHESVPETNRPHFNG